MQPGQPNSTTLTILPTLTDEELAAITAAVAVALDSRRSITLPTSSITSVWARAGRMEALSPFRPGGVE